VRRRGVRQRKRARAPLRRVGRGGRGAKRARVVPRGHVLCQEGGPRGSKAQSAQEGHETAEVCSSTTSEGGRGAERARIVPGGHVLCQEGGLRGSEAQSAQEREGGGLGTDGEKEGPRAHRRGRKGV
jgi:hypothetical protein